MLANICFSHPLMTERFTVSFHFVLLTLLANFCSLAGLLDFDSTMGSSLVSLSECLSCSVSDLCAGKMTFGYAHFLFWLHCILQDTFRSVPVEWYEQLYGHINILCFARSLLACKVSLLLDACRQWWDASTSPWLDASKLLALQWWKVFYLF